MLKIYHNPRCSKSREALNYLKDKKQDFEVVEYLKEPLTKAKIEELLLKLNQRPEEIIRTQEEVYKKEFKGKEFTHEEWVKIIVENPKLLQRPIVETNYKAVVARPAEEIDKLM